MSDTPAKLSFDVTARHLDAHGSTAHCKDADLALDTDLAGRRDAFNPAELLLAALSACMLKSIGRVAPILKFQLRGSRCTCTAYARTCRRAWSRSTTKSWSTATKAIIVSRCCMTTSGDTARSTTLCRPAPGSRA